MEKLRQDIKTGAFERVYLLYGEERYLVQSYKSQLKTAIVGDDTMNFNQYTGKALPVQEVEETAMTLPFFAEKRMLLLEDTGLFKSSADDRWIDLVKNIPQECHILFVEQEVDKRSRMYKAVKDGGYCAEMTHPSIQQRTQWVLKGFGRNGLRLTQAALDAFLEKTGEDMENIRNEMDKLSAFCMGKEGITKDDVDYVCTEQTENRIFDMTQAVAEGKTQYALELYYDLLALKESGMRILFLIARQMNQLLCVKEMEKNRQTKDQIAAALKVRPFVVNKLTAQARQFTIKQLTNCVERCVELEEAVKKGNMNERIAVEMVLLSISNRMEAESL